MTERFFRVVYVTAVMIWTLSVVNLFAQPAYAYVDPGAGLLALQIIGSTIAGSIFLIRKRIRKAFMFIRKGPKEATKPVEQP